MPSRTVITAKLDVPNLEPECEMSSPASAAREACTIHLARVGQRA